MDTTAERSLKEEEGPRVAGVVFRGYLKALETLGHYETVRAAAPPEVKKLFEEVPSSMIRAPYSALVSLLDAIAAATSRDVVRQVALTSVQTTTAPLMAPLLRTLQMLSGAGPAAMFKRLDTLVGVSVKGVKFTWQDETATSGTLVVSTSIALTDAASAAWEGVMSFANDIFKQPVTVHRAVLRPDHRSAAIRISW